MKMILDQPERPPEPNHLIVTDPEILSGDPVFRGTRVPVHMVADLVSQGSTEAELRDGYPHLTQEMIRLAAGLCGRLPNARSATQADLA